MFAGAGGEFAATSGERVVVPAGASPEDLPVDLVPIPADEFPLAVPAGHTLFRAFVLDLHGAPLSRDLQVTIPGAGTLPDGTVALVVQLVDVGEATRLVLVATAQPQAGSLVTTVDPLGNGAVVLPGLRSEGRYAVLFAAGTFGFVTGDVTAADGSPSRRRAARRGQPADRGAQRCRGPLHAARGSRRQRRHSGLRTRRMATAPWSTRQVPHGNFSVTNRPAPLGASPPVVVAVTPGNGVVGVPLGSSITVTFSEPVDPASITVDAVRLANGATPVAGTVALAPGNAALSFRPASLLLSHTPGPRCQSRPPSGTPPGTPFAAPFLSQFTTVDVTPPAPPPAGTVVASIPDASGNTTITGSQGTADPGGVVLIRNLRNNALTTLTPNTDGSFSGVVAALRSDRLEMTIRDAAGNMTILPVAPFRRSDGAVVVGAEGGRVDGPGGVFVEVPPGALPDGTIVHLAPVAQSELPLAAPSDFPFVGAVRLDLGGAIPAESLDLAIPAPPDATPDDQVLVARAITIPTGPAWTLADRAQLFDGKYRTASPPFPGRDRRRVVFLLSA